MLKQGGYRGADNYLTRAKDEHVTAGYPWDDFLALASRRCRTSITRGIGPARQSFELDLNLLARLPTHEAPITPFGPVGAVDCFMQGPFFSTVRSSSHLPRAGTLHGTEIQRKSGGYYQSPKPTQGLWEKHALGDAYARASSRHHAATVRSLANGLDYSASSVRMLSTRLGSRTCPCSPP